MTKLFTIYNEFNCEIACVDENELEQLKKDGIIKSTDRIEEDEFGYND